MKYWHINQSKYAWDWVGSTNRGRSQGRDWQSRCFVMWAVLCAMIGAVLMLRCSAGCHTVTCYAVLCAIMYAESLLCARLCTTLCVVIYVMLYTTLYVLCHVVCCVGCSMLSSVLGPVLCCVPYCVFYVVLYIMLYAALYVLCRVLPWVMYHVDSQEAPCQ